MKHVFAILLVALSLTTPSAASDLQSFRSPSDNIHCIAARADNETIYGSVECEIAEASGALALPKPSDCELEWGGRFIVNQTGRSEMVCHGDTLRNEGTPILLYGSGIQFGGITCEVSEGGVECKNAEGRGFFLSKARQKLF